MSSKRRRNNSGNMADIIQLQSLATNSASQDSSLPNHESSPTDTEDTSDLITKTKGRGSAKGLENWGTGGKLNVDFNERVQPIGKNATKLSSHLGIIARNGKLLPLTVSDWRKMPSDALERVWKEVQDNANVSEKYKKKCLHSIGLKWKDFKSRVKDKYMKNCRNEALQNKIPEHVELDQWENLKKYWNLEHVKNQASVNSKNRAQLATPHRMGKKSFARIARERISQNLPTDRMSMFIATRTPSNTESICSSETLQVINVMNQKLDELPPESQTAEHREKIFTQVMGLDGHGRVKMLGVGVIPTEVCESKASSSSILTLELLETQLKEQEKKITRIEEQHNVQIFEMRKQHDAEMSEMRSQLQMLIQSRQNLPSPASRQVFASDSTSAHQPNLSQQDVLKEHEQLE